MKTTFQAILILAVMGVLSFCLIRSAAIWCAKTPVTDLTDMASVTVTTQAQPV